MWINDGGQWVHSGPKLSATDAVGRAHQGYSVALSKDGMTALVGGPADNGGTGAAWVYTRDNAGRWTQQAKLVDNRAPGAGQGYSVALSADGSTALVGGPFDNGFLGSVWAWGRSGSTWTQQAKLVPLKATGFPNLGLNSVALSADGNIALAGGPGDNGGVGATWVFVRSFGAWIPGQKLVGSNAVGPANQGQAVALSDNGATALIGGPTDDAGMGAAWVFTKGANGGWTQYGEKLVGSPPGGGRARQGSSVALSADGIRALVGGPGYDGNRGATWVFELLATGLFSRAVWAQQAVLVGTDIAGGAQQGLSVALSGQGSVAIVGGPFDNGNVGAVWAFSLPR